MTRTCRRACPLVPLALAFAGAGPLLAPWATGASAPPPPDPVAVIHTTHGDITLALRAGNAPRTVERFIGHVRRGVYDGYIFDRVDERRVVYTGAYDRNWNLKGSGTRLASVRELNNGLANRRATVGICGWFVNNPQDSHELYFCLSDVPEYEGQHTLFAEVTDGLDVLDAIAVSADDNGRPGLIVEIERIEIRE